MKITIFNGSPKAEKSNTDVIAKAFLNGAEKSGAETEIVYLAEKTINYCNGCFSCWFKTPGKCVHDDDMARLIDKYLDSDIVCFASPVYTWNMTALMKNFVDRLAPLKSPILSEKNGDYDLEDTEKKTVKFMVIANAGFPGENNFGTIKQVFSPCQPVLEIYRNCGMALKKDDVRVVEYLNAVSDAGFELVSQGFVSDKTFYEINKEMIPIGEYVQMIGM